MDNLDTPVGNLWHFRFIGNAGLASAPGNKGKDRSFTIHCVNGHPGANTILGKDQELSSIHL